MAVHRKVERNKGKVESLRNTILYYESCDSIFKIDWENILTKPLKTKKNNKKQTTPKNHKYLRCCNFLSYIEKFQV